MSVSMQRDLRDAFECSMRKTEPHVGLERDNGEYINPRAKKLWVDFLILGVDVLGAQGRA